MTRQNSSEPPPDDAGELLDAIGGIRPWKRGHERAPHKPLLLLLALGRVQRGEPREVRYEDLDAPLRGLLERFGPARTSYHPEYPFWYLQNDGLWRVSDASALPFKKGGGSPTKSTLLTEDARAGLPPRYDALLRQRPELIARAARLLLDEHFPTSYHDQLLADAGLNLDTERETVSRKKRDPRFPKRVLRAYEFRCAMCELDIQIDGRSVGLEAAHVWWHTHGGASSVSNGVALCPVHHRTLDLGIWTLTDERTVVISRRLHGGPAVRNALGRFHGAPLRSPQAGEEAIALENVRWHRSEVFREPGRPLAVA